ncbi:MAG: hypothetical protein DCC67_20055 [Planctomycetota bacterium]|nr:MAG: hypothetical protein DCC67_20055 [Planctomycetota bacterium]
MSYERLIDQYLAGPQMLREAVAGLSPAELDARPIPGKWSTREVVCHIADFEPIYADRMKRVVAENKPTFFGGDPDVFAAGLAYGRRNVADELELVDVVRRTMSVILRGLRAEDFQRVGVHSEYGPLSLEELLRRITGHIPHHVATIKEKRAALGR